MTYVQRADRLRALTGLEWTAAENFHSATDGKRRYTMRQEFDGVWTCTIIYRGMEYTVAARSGTWEEVCGWLLKQLEMEAA